MFKKYLPFFGLQLLANCLWLFWVLPSLEESGSVIEMAAWLGAQVLLPVFLSFLIARRRKIGYWLTVIYGLHLGLFALGMTGWSLMSEWTPFSVYAVSAIFFVVSFGTVFLGLKDLNIGQKARRYDEIKDE